MSDYEDDRFIVTNFEEGVRMIDAPLEVSERELQHTIDLIKDKTTVGVYALIIQRPVAEFEERLRATTQFIPINMGAGTLMDLVERAYDETARTLIQTFLDYNAEQEADADA